jgi:hypothetical protein
VKGRIEAFLVLFRDMRKSNNIQGQQVCRSSRYDINIGEFQAFVRPPASIGRSVAFNEAPLTRTVRRLS